MEASMWKTIEKLAALFCVIVFVTFMLNHGHISFTGVDWVKDRATEVITSEEGQQYVQETKEISKGVFHDLFYGIKELLTGEGDPDEPIKDVTLTEAALLSCIDGDTIKVSINGKEETVRMIGIDAPESVSPNADTNNEFGKKASDYVSTLLSNVTTVYLEYDVSTEDNGGRTLAYVWVTPEPKDVEKDMVNAIIIKNGYAVDALYLPNNKYADIFQELREKAQNSKTGLWDDKEFRKLYNE